MNYIQTMNDQIQKNVKDWVNHVSSNSNKSLINTVKKAAALKLATTFVGKSIPFATRNGFKIIDFKPGYVKALIPLKPNINHFNAMYAGALFTVAELPGGIISISSFDDKFFPILKDLKMDFIKVAKTDITVEFEISSSLLNQLEAEALEFGKAAFSLEGELKDKEGNIVARSTANYQLRTR